MTLLADILSLLDRWEPWKRITAAPERLDALERRIAALEAKLGGAPGVACRYCGGVMRLESEKPHEVLGDLGVAVETWRCSACDRTDQRQRGP